MNITQAVTYGTVKEGVMKEIQKSQVLPNSVYCIVNGHNIKKNPITNDSKGH